MTFAAWCLSLAVSFLLPHTLQAQPTAPGRDAILTASRTIITNARYATFVSAALATEAPSARVIDPFAPEADFTIWFATNPKSRKVQEIQKDGRVTLLYFDASSKSYVALKGRATLVRDASEKATRWKDDWKGMYANQNHGEDYLLVKFVPDTLEVTSVALNMNNDPATWKPVTLKLR